VGVSRLRVKQFAIKMSVPAVCTLTQSAVLVHRWKLIERCWLFKQHQDTSFTNLVQLNHTEGRHREGIVFPHQKAVRSHDVINGCNKREEITWFSFRIATSRIRTKRTFQNVRTESKSSALIRHTHARTHTQVSEVRTCQLKVKSLSTSRRHLSVMEA